MSMTVHTAHVFVVSKDKNAYFKLSFDNEECPELVIKNSASTFIDEFRVKANREKLISNAFDSSYGWDDIEPHTLADEVEFSSDYRTVKGFKKFCKEIKEFDDVSYVLFAEDSNKHDWMGYSSYYYDAMVFDFNKCKLFTIGWRGTKLAEDEDSWEERPFYRSTAEYLIKMIQSEKSEEIDVGDFAPSGKQAGKVVVTELAGEKKEAKQTARSSSDDEENDLERIISLIKKVDSIDFNNKAFVFDRLDYVPINGEFAGPDSPNHPIVKKVIDAGGVMRKSVSGKTDYLVLDDSAINTGMSAKCRDALKQIDKGKDIVIITVSNLLSVMN